MALQQWTVGDPANSADFNALVDDLPRSFVYGFTPMEWSKTSTTWPSTPDFTMRVDPLLGRYIYLAAELDGGTGTVTLRMRWLPDGGSTEETLVTLTHSGAYGLEAGVKDLTAVGLGDAQGLSGELRFEFHGSDGSTVKVRNVKVCSGATSDTTKYLD